MSSDFQPLQLKGEIMDLEFTLDTDHRLVHFRALGRLQYQLAELINR